MEVTQMSINRTDKKICGTYTMEYFSHKKNKILPFVAMWMDLENIMLSEGKTNTVWNHL